MNNSVVSFTAQNGTCSLVIDAQEVVLARRVEISGRCHVELVFRNGVSRTVPVEPEDAERLMRTLCCGGQK